MVAAVVLAVALSGCSRNRSDLPALEDASAEAIYGRAEYELALNNLGDAARYFGEVERLHPYSEFAKRALIMQAFTYHADREYESSRASAQRFIDFYPADEDAAYALPLQWFGDAVVAQQTDIVGTLVVHAALP